MQSLSCHFKPFDESLCKAMGVNVRENPVGTGGKVSITDHIAYQIGWGKCLIGWYESGIKGEVPIMPGEGFSIWDYTAIARHFYKKYQYHHRDEQNQVFHEVFYNCSILLKKNIKQEI